MAVLEKKLPIGAAAGASGWTYAVMKVTFLRNGDYSDRASLLLATFCNLMLSGQLRSQVWLRNRSVFVPKKNGRPHPLGIGDSWYRFVGRVALSKVGDRVGSALSPVQLGIGVKNGAEIGGRMAQLVFDSEDNLVPLSLDNENGFITLPPAPVWLCSPRSCSIGSSMPTAAPLLSFAKGSLFPTWPLGASRGKPLGPSCTPLAFSLLFSLFKPSESKTMPVVALRR
jgi:hypothetical protein